MNETQWVLFNKDCCYYISLWTNKSSFLVIWSKSWPFNCHSACKNHVKSTKISEMKSDMMMKIQFIKGGDVLVDVYTLHLYLYCDIYNPWRKYIESPLLKDNYSILFCKKINHICDTAEHLSKYSCGKTDLV